MRTILTSLFILIFSLAVSGQKDFTTLDQQSYNYFINHDYDNLRSNAKELLAIGADYYFLRMRLGIAAYNEGNYREAWKDFNRAKEFSSTDTLVNEYLYFSYLFAGRNEDARMFLNTVPGNLQTRNMIKLNQPFSISLTGGSSFAGFSKIAVGSNYTYRELLNNSRSFDAGLEIRLRKRTSLTMNIESFSKSGIFYYSAMPSGADFRMTQLQAYGNLTISLNSGLNLSLFGTGVIYPDLLEAGKVKYEFNQGAGLSKKWWLIHAGTNLSHSNFGFSDQIRGEAYFTFLPYGNLKLYFTSTGMFQHDINWGQSFRLSQAAGFRISKLFWTEAGFIAGNSFLYSGSEGAIINNSFQVPVRQAWVNFIYLPSDRISITFTPFYTLYNNYGWLLDAFSSRAMHRINSAGLGIKIRYNH